MNIYEIALVILVCILLTLLMLYTVIYLFFKKIYTPHKKSIVSLDFETSLFILKTIINTELDAYDNDIFISKGSITNTNFDNYYKDITGKIIKNLSPDLIRHLSLYITEDMVYTVVARAVKKFLAEKVTGTV